MTNYNIKPPETAIKPDTEALRRKNARKKVLDRIRKQRAKAQS